MAVCTGGISFGRIFRFFLNCPENCGKYRVSNSGFDFINHLSHVRRHLELSVTAVIAVEHFVVYPAAVKYFIVQTAEFRNIVYHKMRQRIQLLLDWFRHELVNRLSFRREHFTNRCELLKNSFREIVMLRFRKHSCGIVSDLSAKLFYKAVFLVVEFNELVVIGAFDNIYPYLVANHRIDLVYKNLLRLVPPHDMNVRLSLFQMNRRKVLDVFLLQFHVSGDIADMEFHPFLPVNKRPQSGFLRAFRSERKNAVKYIAVRS